MSDNDIIMAENKATKPIEIVYNMAKNGLSMELSNYLEKIPYNDVNTLINQIIVGENEQEDSPFLIAAFNGKTEIVKLLLDKYKPILEQEGKIISSNIGIICGASPLWCAAAGGHLNIVKLLVQAGANVNHGARYYSSPLKIAISLGRLDIVEYLTEHKANIDMEYKNNGINFIVVVHTGFVDIVTFLLRHGANPNEVDYDGETVLHVAVKNDNDNIVTILLEHGANPNETDDLGRTALHLATSQNNDNIVTILLEHGANPNEKDNDRKYQTPLYLAASQNNDNILRILLEHGANPNEKDDDDGRTALHQAVSYGYDNIIRILLKHDVDLNVQDENGDTVLHEAVKNDDWSTIKILLEYGAKNIMNKLNMRPLTVAAENRNSIVVEQFIANDDDLTREEIIEAYELLGSSFVTTDPKSRVTGYNYLRKAMILRYSDVDNIITKKLIDPVLAYGKWRETENLESLEIIQHDGYGIYMESLTIRERILGKHHPNLILHIGNIEEKT